MKLFNKLSTYICLVSVFSRKLLVSSGLQGCHDDLRSIHLRRFLLCDDHLVYFQWFHWRPISIVVFYTQLEKDKPNIPWIGIRAFFTRGKKKLMFENQTCFHFLVLFFFFFFFASATGLLIKLFNNVPLTFGICTAPTRHVYLLFKVLMLKPRVVIASLELAHCVPVWCSRKSSHFMLCCHACAIEVKTKLFE